MQAIITDTGQIRKIGNDIAGIELPENADVALLYYDIINEMWRTDKVKLLTRLVSDAIPTNDIDLEPISFSVSLNPTTITTNADIDKIAIINAFDALCISIDTQEFIDLRKDLLSQANTKKKEMRDGGFDVSGTTFDSDINARMSYAELAMQLLADSAYSTTWKSSDGVWVTMDAILYAQVASAGETHIASTFTWLAGKQTEINACTTVAELQAIAI